MSNSNEAFHNKVEELFVKPLAYNKIEELF